MGRLKDPEPIAEELQKQFEAIRAQHNLRAVSAEENGTGVDRLAAGVYGFTYSPAEENFPLFSAREFRTYEAHKLADGSVVIYGFIKKEEKEAMEKGEAKISLYAEPVNDVDELVAVPMTRVASRVEYSQRGASGLVLQLRA